MGGNFQDSEDLLVRRRRNRVAPNLEGQNNAGQQQNGININAGQNAGAPGQQQNVRQRRGSFSMVPGNLERMRLQHANILQETEDQQQERAENAHPGEQIQRELGTDRAAAGADRESVKFGTDKAGGMNTFFNLWGQASPWTGSLMIAGQGGLTAIKNYELFDKDVIGIYSKVQNPIGATAGAINLISSYRAAYKGWHDADSMGRLESVGNAASATLAGAASGIGTFAAFGNKNAGDIMDAEKPLGWTGQWGTNILPLAMNAVGILTNVVQWTGWVKRKNALNKAKEALREKRRQNHYTDNILKLSDRLKGFARHKNLVNSFQNAFATGQSISGVAGFDTVVGLSFAGARIITSLADFFISRRKKSHIRHRLIDEFLRIDDATVRAEAGANGDLKAVRRQLRARRMRELGYHDEHKFQKAVCMTYAKYLRSKAFGAPRHGVSSSWICSDAEDADRRVEAEPYINLIRSLGLRIEFPSRLQIDAQRHNDKRISALYRPSAASIAAKML